MLCALIKNDIVDRIEDLTEEEIQSRARSYDFIIELTEVVPKPQVGWEYKNGVFNIPVGATVERRITKLAFMSRMRSTELGHIYTIANTQGHPLQINFQIFRDMLMAATFIDLARADTIANVGALVTAGILTTARAQEILTAPVQRHEIPGL